MSIAIITARGGSKRIPRKNIRSFMGHPMIAWPIAVARASRLFSDIIVSTEDDEIADIARQCGASVPFMRPINLADDFTPTAPVLAHALAWLQKHASLPRYVCCIYPTSPFLRPQDLVEGRQCIEKHNASCTLSACTFDFPILRAFCKDENGYIAYKWPQFAGTRSQDLPEFLHDAGQFYWVDTDAFLKHPSSLLGKAARPVILPRSRVQDLDTPEDWDIAENMAKALRLCFPHENS